jgi:predicted secreted Zn-dependent protease
MPAVSADAQSQMTLSGVHGMIKQGIFSLMLVAVAVTISGAENGLDVARIDDNLRPDIQKVSVPVVTEKYEYYEIKGSSEKELRIQMCRNGCRVNDGNTYDSVTAWHWRMDYGYGRAPGACSADSFTVALEIDYRYPQWVDAGNAPQPLVDKWNDYMKHLVTHETGHRDIAVEAAAGLSRAVAALPPARSCDELDREVRALGHERMKKLNNDEKGYDETTGHGKAQGAVFP